jgi:ferredoxin/flavodoxin---NADP+ reductase
VLAIGNRAAAIPGLPFDGIKGTIPHEDGRIEVAGDESGSLVYVVGWAKRGPSGVFGTNRADAAQTVAALIPRLRPPAQGADRPDPLRELLRRSGTQTVTWQGWQTIDAAERQLGESAGHQRVKIASNDGLLRAPRKVGSTALRMEAAVRLSMPARNRVAPPLTSAPARLATTRPVLLRAHVP